MLLKKMEQTFKNYDFSNLKDYRLYEGFFIVNGDSVEMIVREFYSGLEGPSPIKFFFRKGDEFEKVKGDILENLFIKLGKNAIQLDENNYLVNWYGKYDPQMTFIISWDTIQYFHWNKPDYNMNIEFDGDPYFMYGNYWVSRKGKNCFRPLPKDRAEHMLVKVDWERGLFRQTYGKNPELKNAALYYHRARSKGGGVGNTYYVLPKGYVHEEKWVDYLP